MGRVPARSVYFGKAWCVRVIRNQPEPKSPLLEAKVTFSSPALWSAEAFWNAGKKTQDDKLDWGGSPERQWSPSSHLLPPLGLLPTQTSVFLPRTLARLTARGRRQGLPGIHVIRRLRADLAPWFSGHVKRGGLNPVTEAHEGLHGQVIRRASLPRRWGARQGKIIW